MTYNVKELSEFFQSSILNINKKFYEEKNLDFLSSLKENIFNNQYDYAYGATKFVLIPFNEDYVIKIPYTGAFYDCYNDKNSCSVEVEYRKFYGSNNEKRPWDYCATEVERYNIAKELNLNMCFAETRFLTFVNNYPIYIQEKCTVFSSCIKNHKHSKDEISRTFKISGYPDFIIDENWLTDFRLYHGNQIFIDFIDTITGLEWADDLRQDNLGYIGSRPVLIDYSGFAE